MQSIDSLRELNSKLLAEIAELRKENTEIPKLREKFAEVEAKNAKLRQIIEENSRRDAENAKQRARIEELEKNSANISTENTELKVRVAKLEQDSKQPQNDSHVEKAVVILESVSIQLNQHTPVCKAEVLEKLSANVIVPEVFKSSEEKAMDKFLDEADKKSVSDRIRQCNKEKKLLCESTKNQIQAVTSVDSKLSRDKKTVTHWVDTRVTQDNLSCDMKMISCVNSKDVSSDEMPGPIAIQPLDRNQLTEQILKHDLSRLISSVASVELHDESILNNVIEGSTRRLAYWIDETIKTGLKEICLYHYSLEFEEKVKNITADGKTKDKTARSMIYKNMLQYLPNITLVTCSTSDISRLNNTQIQNIIDNVNDQVHVISKTVTNGNDKSHVTFAETISSVTSQTKFSSENFNYYGITNEKLCPLCKLGYDDKDAQWSYKRLFNSLETVSFGVLRNG
ncbi:hypothetical protein C1646_776424 [Rhizophagus diaphanus]|nr:hypothetical protein C1646_776424 [Rhizophagus diaphanus] [Rhizophagus sp. MUCL 43196]